MTGEVAHVLNEIALTPESGRTTCARGRRAEASQRVAGPALRLSCRRSAGDCEPRGRSRHGASCRGRRDRFDLNLVANVEPRRPNRFVRRQPKPRSSRRRCPSRRSRTSHLNGSICCAARSTTSTAPLERRRQPRSPPRASSPRVGWPTNSRRSRLYGTLVHDLTTRARLQAERADVRGLERLIQSVPARDASLGRKRPEQVQGLIATLQDRLDAARRLRLARDQWRLRGAAYRA